MVIHLIPFFSIYFFYPQLSFSSTSLLFYPLQKVNFQFSIALGKTICQPNLLFKALGDTGLIPGSGRSPKGGNGNSLQHSCLENPMDRRAWSATVHGVTELDTMSNRAQTHVLLPILLKEPAATNSWAFCDFSVVNLIASWLSHLDSLSLFNDFIYLFMAVLGLHCYAGAFPNCGEQGLLSSWGAQTSHCGGFCCGPAWAQGHSGFSSCGLKVLEHRLNSSAYLAAASGIFLNQGLNPCLSHWQVDSLSLSHQGSLNSPFLGARSVTTCPSIFQL